METNLSSKGNENMLVFSVILELLTNLCIYTPLFGSLEIYAKQQFTIFENKKGNEHTT